MEMMRYWRLISIVAVIVVVVSTFYIQSAVATHQYPAFALEKQRGDEKEAEGVTLHGEYAKEAQYHSLNITTAGSKDDFEGTYFERLARENAPSHIKKLRKDYKAFMRGKDIDMDESMLYDDKSLLAYVELEPFDELDNKYTFDIDILEKESKNRESFKVTQHNDKYSYLDVAGVFVSHGEVIVFTRNYARKSENMEIHAYWFNIADGKLMHEEPILSIDEEDEQTNANINLINSNDGKDNNHFVLFQKDHYVNYNDEQMDSEPWETELLAYDLERKELEKIKLPEEIDGITNTGVINQSKLYFANETEHTFEIFSYDVENEKMKNIYKMKISNAVDPIEDQGITWNIDNNKLYMSSVLSDNISLADLKIVDLDSGDTLYEGTVEAKSQQSLAELDDFIVSGISIE